MTTIQSRSWHLEWVRSLWAALEPHSTGTYVNFMSDEPDAALVTAYGPDKHARLVSLKDRYDPTNFFRFNQNFAPSGSMSS